MYALDNKSGIEQMPEIPEVFSKNPLWFTEGRDGNSPSYPGAHWFNIVQAELLNVLKEAGIEPDKADLTQLAQAFRVMAGQVESIAALREFEPVRDRQVAFVKGYYAGSNKGGGYFIADFADTTTTDNGGTVIVTANGKRWKRIYTNITPEDFGAMGDGVTNDLAALKATSAFNSVVLRNDAVYYIGNVTSSDFDPDFIASGLGKIKWDINELDGYELKKNLKTESIYLAPKSWHEATRKNSSLSPVYPPYAPPGRGNDIYNKYNTVVSWLHHLIIQILKSQPLQPMALTLV